MAPGTYMGAAHPVTLGAAEADTVLVTKMVEDAAALARAVARCRPERGRRARVTEAKGQREATVRVAEGDKRAAILRAQGAAEALDVIFQVARGVDPNTMSLQYLEMLTTLGAAESTKIVLPAELTNLLRPFLEHSAAAAGTK